METDAHGLLPDCGRTDIEIGHNRPHMSRTEPESEIEKLWIEEAERRLDELESGAVEGIPGDEAFRRARAAISSCSSRSILKAHKRK